MAFPYDQSFKLLSDEDPLGSLTHLAGIQIAAGAVVDSLDREINPERRHADHLYRVRVGNQTSIQHFEVLAYYRADWVDAQLDHAVYVEMKHHLPVYSNLMLMHERGAPAVIQEEIVRDCGGLQLRLRVNVVKLWQRPATEVLETDRVALYPWTALMDATAEQQQEAARRLDVIGREGLQLQMALLGALRYGSKEAFLRRLGSMLLTKEVLRESPLWQEIEREGRAEGKAEARAEDLREILSAQFGPLPEWAEEKIGVASPDTLKRWLKQSIKAASISSALE